MPSCTQRDDLLRVVQGSARVGNSFLSSGNTHVLQVERGDKEKITWPQLGLCVTARSLFAGTETHAALGREMWVRVTGTWLLALSKFVHVFSGLTVNPLLSSFSFSSLLIHSYSTSVHLPPPFFHIPIFSHTHLVLHINEPFILTPNAVSSCAWILG